MNPEDAITTPAPGVDANGKRIGNPTHNESSTKLYKIWSGLKWRCDNPKNIYYFQRGITYAAEWKTFEPFAAWARDSGYAPGLSLDRIDYTGPYNSSNCRWVSWRLQARNKRNVKLITAWGETKTGPDWCDDPRCVVALAILRQRLTRDKWQPELAISTPT